MPLCFFSLLHYVVYSIWSFPLAQAVPKPLNLLNHMYRRESQGKESTNRKERAHTDPMLLPPQHTTAASTQKTNVASLLALLENENEIMLVFSTDKRSMAVCSSK